MNHDESNKDEIIAALRAEVDTMKTIISMMPGSVFWKNLKGQYMGCNNNMAKIYKLSSPEELIGKTDADFLDSELLEYITQIDRDVLKKNKEKRIEETGIDPSGKPAIYLTQKTPYYDRHGKIQGILGISLDITARKQMEDNLKIAKKKAEAANRAKSQFLAMISHELRTPLTSILGFVSFLEQENLTEEKKQYIQYITNSGSYLFSLINNLLDYNKLETNNYELAKVPFDLKKTMTDVINMLSGSARLKNIDLLIDYDPIAPDYIISDNRILRQILVNLVGNAIKFTEKGRVSLCVKCVTSTPEFSELLIEVIDTGIGIHPKDQRAIFKKFHQVGNVYTRNSSLTGTGLGLAIVKKLVKLIGSQIKVKSTPHQGSTFYFNVRFPNITVEQKQQILSLKSSIEVLSSSKPNTLLIEDDALIQIVHKQMLEELGCQVNIAECANRALEMIKNNYDIVFVDIGLPDMDGFELIRTIKKKHLINRQIPIVALTGYSEAEERQQCLYAGANEVAVKPISKESLGKILERHLRV